MVEKSDVAAVLELIRPSLQADGGDVQLVDVSDDGGLTWTLLPSGPVTLHVEEPLPYSP